MSREKKHEKKLLEKKFFVSKAKCPLYRVSLVLESDCILLIQLCTQIVLTITIYGTDEIMTDFLRWIASLSAWSLQCFFARKTNLIFIDFDCVAFVQMNVLHWSCNEECYLIPSLVCQSFELAFRELWLTSVPT